MKRLIPSSVPPWVLVGVVAMALLFVSPTAQADTFNIEIDYMVGVGHTHMPTQDEVDAVVQMFACRGHTLNILVDDALTHYQVLNRDPADTSFFNYEGVANSFGAIRNSNFDNDGVAGWHYAIFGHQYQNRNLQASGSSGLGQRPGILFLVTLGTFNDSTGTPSDKAWTLAHEFGHNLGLGHCGDMNCDDTIPLGYVGQGAPILASIMSYQYQLVGVRNQMMFLGLIRANDGIVKNLDYSQGRMCTQVEVSLNEDFGTGMVPVDWDCDGDTTGTTSEDLLAETALFNLCSSNSSTAETVQDLDEWSAIQSPASPEYLAAREAQGFVPEEVECITFEEHQRVLERLGKLQTGGSLVEPCNSGQIVFISSTGNSGNQVGTCQLPATDFANGVNNVATNNSEIYLRNETYNITGPLLITKQVKIFSVVSAVIK